MSHSLGWNDAGDCGDPACPRCFPQTDQERLDTLSRAIRAALRSQGSTIDSQHADELARMMIGVKPPFEDEKESRCPAN